jgi:hypothetical protein
MVQKCQYKNMFRNFQQRYCRNRLINVISGLDLVTSFWTIFCYILIRELSIGWWIFYLRTQVLLIG